MLNAETVASGRLQWRRENKLAVEELSESQLDKVHRPLITRSATKKIELDALAI